MEAELADLFDAGDASDDVGDELLAALEDDDTFGAIDEEERETDETSAGAT